VHWPCTAQSRGRAAFVSCIEGHALERVIFRETVSSCCSVCPLQPATHLKTWSIIANGIPNSASRGDGPSHANEIRRAAGAHGTGNQYIGCAGARQQRAGPPPLAYSKPKGLVPTHPIHLRGSPRAGRRLQAARRLPRIPHPSSAAAPCPGKRAARRSSGGAAFFTCERVGVFCSLLGSSGCYSDSRGSRRLQASWRLCAPLQR
jgi:hypothetical protein